MPELIGIRDAGFTTDRGHNVARLIFRFSINEARPVEVEGRCHAVYKDAVMKSLLKRLYFPKPEFDVSQHRPKIDQAEYIEALESLNWPQAELYRLTGELSDRANDLPANSMIVPIPEG